MPTSIIQRAGLVASVLSAITAAPAWASTVFYTDEAAFLAAAGTTTNFDFSGLVGPTGAQSYSSADGFTRDGVNFVGTTGTGGYSLGVEGPDFIPADYNHGLNQASLQSPAATSGFYGITSGVLTITLPQNTTAFGLNLFSVLAGDYSGAGTDTVTLTAGGTSGQVVTPPYTGAAFLGVVSSTPLTTLTLTGTANEEFPTIVDVTFGSAAMSPVPLPGAAPLFGAALAALGAVGYRLKRGARTAA